MKHPTNCLQKMFSTSKFQTLLSSTPLAITSGMNVTWSCHPVTGETLSSTSGFTALNINSGSQAVKNYCRSLENMCKILCFYKII